MNHFIRLKKYATHPYAFFSLLILAPLPMLYFLYCFYCHMQDLSDLQQRLDIIQIKALNLRLQKEKESSFYNQINQADHYYIDKYLETLSFLEPEIKTFKSQLAENADSSFFNKIKYLEESNRLLFSEDAIRQNDQIQEVEERQQVPVEMNEQDLKKLLTLVEGVHISPFTPKSNRPQLIIKNFELAKKTITPQDPVFVVNMQLIKREKINNQYE